MAEDVINTTGIASHGAGRLPSVDIDSFNIELKDDEGFLDRKSTRLNSSHIQKSRMPSSA